MRVIVVIHKGQGNKLLVSNEPAEPIVKDTVSKAEGGGACLERCAKYRGFSIVRNLAVSHSDLQNSKSHIINSPRTPEDSCIAFAACWDFATS